jgi:hypothetical protein
MPSTSIDRARQCCGDATSIVSAIEATLPLRSRSTKAKKFRSIRSGDRTPTGWSLELRTQPVISIDSAAFATLYAGALHAGFAPALSASPAEGRALSVMFSQQWSDICALN